MENFLAWLRSNGKQLTVIAIAILVIVLFLVGFRWPPENMTAWGRALTLIGVVILLLAAIIYALKEPDRTGDEPMPRWKRSFLMAYLLVVGALLVLMLVSLSSLDFPETPVVAQEAPVGTPTPTPTPSPTLPATQPTAPATQPTAPAPQPATAAPATAGRPVAPAPTATPIVPMVARVFPQTTGGTPPTQYLTIYGRNFQDKSEVRFDGTPVMSKLLVSDLLRAQLRAEDLEGKGSIMIDVKNPDGAVSNAISVPIDKPKVVLNVLFFWRFWRPLITREMQLLLMVILAGALGSYLHSIMSIADFIGSRKLKISWFWWYLTRPFLGMAMGLVFYAMLRGGFLVGTPADEKFVNPFGVIAIGTLVGMFSDKAAQKLGEIFDVVFRAAAPRPDKLDESVPVITKLDPSTVQAGSEDTVVKIIGEGLAKVSKVKVNGVERPAMKAVDKEVSFTLTKTDLAKASTIEIAAIDADGDTSGTANFEVTAAEDGEPPGEALITGLNPPTLPAGSPDTEVKIIGEHLATTAKVKVNDAERAVTSASETEVLFTLAAAEIATPSTPTITLLDNTGEVLVVTTDFVVEEVGD